MKYLWARIWLGRRFAGMMVPVQLTENHVSVHTDIHDKVIYKTNIIGTCGPTTYYTVILAKNPTVDMGLRLLVDGQAGKL